MNAVPRGHVLVGDGTLTSRNDRRIVLSNGRRHRDELRGFVNAAVAGAILGLAQRLALGRHVSALRWVGATALGLGVSFVLVQAAGALILGSSVFPALLGWLAIPIGVALLVGALEFVSPKESKGWWVAERVTPIAYIAWSVWFIAFGVVLLLS